MCETIFESYSYFYGHGSLLTIKNRCVSFVHPERVADRAADNVAMYENGLADYLKLFPVAFPCAEVEFVPVIEHQKEQVFIRFGVQKRVQPVERILFDVPARHRQIVGLQLMCYSFGGKKE